MSTERQEESPVNRLTDIVVEEVSLVDRAANKHRFLIVKRRDDVDDSTTESETEQTPDEGADETEPTEDGETGDVAEVDTPEADDEEAVPVAPIEVVAETLERLTDAVELLGTLDEAEAKTRVAELAGELRYLTEQLAGLAGDETESAADDDATAPSETAAVDDRPTEPEIRIEEPAQPSTELREQIQALAEELRILVGAVKEQGQRLARLEKRSGLPNSAPPGERRSVKKDEEEVSWPLDLNRDRDRDHVDAAVSFHDE